MKQNRKKIWLVLSLIVCLALAGCAKKSAADEAIDPMTESSVQQGTEQYLNLFNSLTDDMLDQMTVTAEKNKDTVMANALNSWKSVKGDLGAFQSNEPAAVTKSADGYTAKVNAVYEQRNMEFTLIVDEELSNITTISFTPEYTVGEKMEKAALNTLMGMGTVFVVLIFISWLIGRFKYINQWEANARKKAADKAAAANPAPAPAPALAPAVPAAPAAAPTLAAEEETADVSDDTELAAVIAAAIAASEGMVSADGLVVRSIKHVPNRNWKKA